MRDEGMAKLMDPCRLSRANGISRLCAVRTTSYSPQSMKLTTNAGLQCLFMNLTLYLILVQFLYVCPFLFDINYPNLGYDFGTYALLDNAI